ncbi:MAG TPA: hypothetical protein VMD27_06370 [Candidatus Aquilonibacter sp.]|nr:hypothetical protein [Candidatus Aquilonibacter sp.]
MSKFQLQTDDSGRVRVAPVTDVPGALKHLSKLLARNAQVRISPYMTQSQLTAAFAEKAELALEAGRFYKTALKPNRDDWETMSRSEMARCLGFEAGDVERPNLTALEAGDYSDPNNQFGILNGTLVMLKALPLYAYEYPELTAMFTDFSAEPGEFEQETPTRVISIPAVQKYNNDLDANGRPIGFVTASPPKTLDVPLTLTDYIAVPIVIGQGTLGATLRDLFAEQAPAGIKAIASYFTGMVTALLTPANYNAYSAVTNDNPQTVPVAYATYAKGITDWSMTDLDKLSAIFTTCKVPRTERGILLNPTYYAKLRSDPRLEFFFAASKGDPMLTEQTLPQGLSGFFPYEAPYLPLTLPFFPFHKAGIVLKSRLPKDFISALKLNANQIPGSITTVTDPDTKLSVALVQRVDLIGNYAEWRPETMLGVGVGDNRGGLCGAAQ